VLAIGAGLAPQIAVERQARAANKPYLAPAGRSIPLEPFTSMFLQMHEQMYCVDLR
jgi:hypothetical protein